MVMALDQRRGASQFMSLQGLCPQCGDIVDFAKTEISQVIHTSLLPAVIGHVL